MHKLPEALIRAALAACALVSVGVCLAIVVVLLREAMPFFREVGVGEFLTGTRWTPLLQPRSFGVLPLVAGTLLIAGLAAAVAIPAGLLSAVYLSEIAGQRTRRCLKPVLEVLAGVPTVVYGYFALTVVTPAIRWLLPQTQVFNALSAGLVVGIMILPMVASLSDDAMRAVPAGLREGAFALGSTRREVILGVLVPGALPGILASALLAISRALGETMIVALAAGATPRMTGNPLDSIQTMTGYIVQVSLGDAPAGTVEYRSIFAVGLLLFSLTLVMNLLATKLKHRFHEAYA